LTAFITIIESQKFAKNEYLLILLG